MHCHLSALRLEDTQPLRTSSFSVGLFRIELDCICRGSQLLIRRPDEQWVWKRETKGSFQAGQRECGALWERSFPVTAAVGEDLEESADGVLEALRKRN